MEFWSKLGCFCGVFWGLSIFVSLEAQPSEYFGTALQEEVRQYFNPGSSMDLKSRAESVADYLDENSVHFDQLRRDIYKDIESIRLDFQDQPEEFEKRVEIFFGAMNRVVEERNQRRGRRDRAIVLGAGAAGALAGLTWGLVFGKTKPDKEESPLKKPDEDREENLSHRLRRSAKFAVVGGTCGALLGWIVTANLSTPKPHSFDSSVYSPYAPTIASPLGAAPQESSEND